MQLRLESLDHPGDPSSEGRIAHLRNTVDQLMQEKVLSTRMKVVEVMSNSLQSSANVSDIRILTETLATCWEERQYSGLEAVKWRTCILQAADGPSRMAKDVPESFVLYLELAIKSNRWCTKIASPELAESVHQAELSLSQIQIAVIRLASAVFEGVADAYLSAELLFKEPFSMNVETLISTSFELVKVVYAPTMRKDSLQPGDEELLRKRCQELLSLAFRLVHVFRRQIVGPLPRNIDDSRRRISPGNIVQVGPTALRVVASSVRHFTELGNLSTATGSLALLNVSWKSTMALLQVEDGREIVASAVDVTSIIGMLISHAVQALKRAVETWFSKSSNAGEKDPRRLCIPIKFFLQTAERISSFYPQKAVIVSSNTVSCASKVYACLLQKDILSQRAAVEAFAELVVPTTFALLHNLLSSQSVETGKKIQLLQDITSDADEVAAADLSVCHDGNDIVDELFCNKSTLSPGGGLLRIGKVALFLAILQVSCNYNEDVLIELLRKLPWLLEEFPKEGLYVLMTQKIVVPTNASVMAGQWKWNWQLMFLWVARALQTFSLVAAKHESVWVEFEYLLFQHVLHPCVICGELILDVWCFIISRSAPALAQNHVYALLSLLRDLSASKSEVASRQRLARVLCSLIHVAPESVAVLVYDTAFQNPFGSEAAASVATMLLQEGFPVGLFKDDLRKKRWEHLLSCCATGGSGLLDTLMSRQRRGSLALDSQKQALTCAFLLLSESPYRGEDVADKYLQEFTKVAQCLISMYTRDPAKSRMFHALGIIGPALGLLPHIQHMLDPKILHALLPRLLEQCQSSQNIYHNNDLKLALAEFLANLSEISIPEDEDNPALKALWGLYHLVLSEKHWGLVHLGLQSFAHFAAHTSCQELWQFVPPDAAVASNVCTEDGTEDLFMTALKAFMEKECAISSLAISEEELEQLKTECNLQQQRKSAMFPQDKLTHDARSRDFEIQEAMAMMWKGIGVLKEGIPEWLRGTSKTPTQWEALRAGLAEVSAQVDAIQRLPG